MNNIPVYKLPESKAFLIGEYPDGTQIVKIPDDDRRRHKFVSLYVRITDLRTSLDVLSLISIRNSVLANRAFFVSSLAELLKCFQGSDKYIILNENKFEKASPIAYKEYCRYKELRNQHFMHESSQLTEAFAFLPVLPECDKFGFLGNPTVIVDNAELDYLQESHSLSWVISEALSFAITEFDKVADSIRDSYKGKSREDLFKFGEVQAISAKLR